MLEPKRKVSLGRNFNAMKDNEILIEKAEKKCTEN